MNNIQAQIDYYNKNRESIETQHSGCVVIVGPTLTVLVYRTIEEAYSASVSAFGYGNFLMKDLTNGRSDTVNMINPSITTTL